jgi:hypothetical protein
VGGVWIYSGTTHSVTFSPWRNEYLLGMTWVDIFKTWWVVN